MFSIVLLRDVTDRDDCSTQIDPRVRVGFPIDHR